MNGPGRLIAFADAGGYDRPFFFMPLIIRRVSGQKVIPYPDLACEPGVRAQAYLMGRR